MNEYSCHCDNRGCPVCDQTPKSEPTGEELNPLWLDGGVKAYVCSKSDGAVFIQLARDQQTFSFDLSKPKSLLLVTCLRQGLEGRR